MGEPATPTKEQRNAVRAAARTIIECVTNDEEIRLGLSVGRAPGGARIVALVDVEQLAFALAQEIQMLSAELAVVDSAIGDWDFAAVAEDAHGTDYADALKCAAWIEAARKDARGV